MSTRTASAPAISPGWVDTDMAGYADDHVDPQDMIRAVDVAEMVVASTRLSAKATVPNIVLTRPGPQIWRP